MDLYLLYVKYIEADKIYDDESCELQQPNNM